MKLLEHYTLHDYATHEQIRNDFDIGSFCVIDEIEKYREQFRCYFIYEGRQHSIVLTNQLKERLLEYLNIQEEDTFHPFIQIFILRNHLDLCEKCLKKYHLSLKYLDTFDYIYSFESDITKSFLEWFAHISSYSCKSVLQYEYKLKQLSVQQQMFLRNEGKRFEIETYMKFMNVSYETARHHLNKMNALGLCIRHKIGKKHIFEKEYYGEDWHLYSR